MIRARAGALLALLPLLGACGMAGYLGHAAWGEARILLSRRPLGQALRDPQLDPVRRARLALVDQAAGDAAAVLGLPRRNQYREVAALPADFAVWVLTVAAADQLTSVTWRFPLAGQVPYLGFFDRDRAVTFAAEHYPDHDVHLRTAAAFSTLGWLPDPVLPGFLEQDDVDLVNTVVHELVHAAVYRAGQSDWNETVASALGDAGTAVLAARWQRHDWAEQLARARADRRLLADRVAATVDGLRAAYAREPEREERLRLKQAGIATLRAELRAASWRDPRWARAADAPINHAWLLARLTYARDPALQASWTEAATRDFVGALVEFRRRAASGDGLWRDL